MYWVAADERSGQAGAPRHLTKSRKSLSLCRRGYAKALGCGVPGPSLYVRRECGYVSRVADEA